MAAYVGTSWVGSWVWSSGTAVLGGDYRQFQYTPSIDLLDETAGSDTNKLYIAAQKDGQASFSALLQAGNVAGGTLLAAGCVEGQVGTLYWSPEGVTASKPKYTLPAISMGAALNYQYNALTELSVTWQQNGTRVEGTN